MTEFIASLSNLLHTTATVVFIGYFAIMVTLVIPILADKETTGLQMLREISNRSRWWLYGAMAVLAATGIYLTLSDSNYSGIGIFDTTWSVLMLVKHIIILAMVGIGFWFNGIKRVGKAMLSTSNAIAGLKGFKRYCMLMSIGSFLVLLLTIFAQVK